MDRKESIKTLLFGTLSLPFFKENDTHIALGDGANMVMGEPLRSDWTSWPDMSWIGPSYWGNRLQDWRIRYGKTECTFSGRNRNLHCLTHQLNEKPGDFLASIEVELLNKTGQEADYVGFRLGAKAKDIPCPVTFVDYRRSAVYGEGLDVGITADGKPFIGDKKADQMVSTQFPVKLQINGIAKSRLYQLVLSVYEIDTGNKIFTMTRNDIQPEKIAGNIALVSHFVSQNDESETTSARFSDWMLSGSKVSYYPSQNFGPILFAQYTLDNKVLKLTAQMTPVETMQNHFVILQVREHGGWKDLETTTIDPLSRTAEFRQDDWHYSEDIPYRILLELPLKDQTKIFYYEGTIAADPVSIDQIKAAVFSCNQHHGFPDTEVVENVTKHRPHLALFLGDQIYEAFGGFGVERSQNLNLATLDYLRKWYMFGWSYRDIFRHIPSLFIPDDHDVFQGNIWGQEGKAADISKGYGAGGHDTGGYTMPAEWVKMIERTQTSHLPDPWDPTPVKQGIGVYYTNWNYAGISFAILEDRKFKTAPANVLPQEAQIWNGFIQNQDFDIKKYYDVDADLLGERQHRFLEEWTADWSKGVQMKVVLSQSPFCNLGTLPAGELSDGIVPRLGIPEKGEYITGDAITLDMDTNGWPAKERDKALKIIRKAFALHIAGDQHLASVSQYGVENFEDAGFVFTLPALNNTWPRRWWPTLEDGHRPLSGRPKYTGNFKDAYGNLMTVLSVANPVKTNRIPGIIYDRSTGYGIVRFDKKKRTIRMECWPRYVDPLTNPEGQYDGWPVIIDQCENYNREATGLLPEFIIKGMDDPVIQVFDEDLDELEYAIRIKGNKFRPKVYKRSTYRVRIGDPDLDKWIEYEKIAIDSNDLTIQCKFT